jgi:hypothetical protein
MQHRREVQQLVAELQAKRQDGSITAEELALLEKLEQRAGPCINGSPRPQAGRMGGPGAGMGRGRGMGTCPGTCALGTATFGEISDAIASDLLFAKQEEKMARDVYQVLLAKWGHRVFENIASAEQRHMDAVSRLIEGYNLEDTTPAEPGKFTIPELQALYDQSVASGTKSLVDALGVGVLIEETDIADLENTLKQELDPPIKQVLENLLRASQNHLAAFNTALAQAKIRAPRRGSVETQRPGQSRPGRR